MYIERLFYISKEKKEEIINSSMDVNDYKAGGNSKAFIVGDYVVLKGSIELKGDYEQIIHTLYELNNNGVNVVPILGYMYREEDVQQIGKKFFVKAVSFQPKAKGKELWDNSKMPSMYSEEAKDEEKEYLLSNLELLASAPQSQYDKWVKDYKVITDYGIMVDPSKKANFFYDKKDGFSFIDLNYKGEPLFNRKDVYENESHREFVKECCLPCLSYCPCEECFSEKEKEKIAKVNIVIFEKCVQGLLKAGVSKENIKNSFKSQITERVSSGGMSIYGVDEKVLDIVLNNNLNNKKGI